MDVSYFFNRRLEFIRQLYDTASAPYAERKRKIEAEEQLFVPPYSEDAEPAFLGEWIEADESLHVLAYSCVSMLAAALHLYLETWVSETRVPVDEALKKSFKTIGWFPGYRTHYSQPSQSTLKLVQRIFGFLKTSFLRAIGLSIRHRLPVSEQTTQMRT